MQDPEALARAIPGCEGLERIGEDEYRMKMKLALASLSGAFEGTVKIADQAPPSSFRLLVEGAGKIGFMKGNGVLRLTASGAGTEVAYQGDAHVGGWVLPREPEPVDEYLMVMLADLWIPAAYHRWQEPAVAASAEITTQFRARFPADLPVGAPLFVELRTAGSIGGFVDEDCSIWSPSGELLSQGRQMRYVHG
jgi:hypothetical protein